MVPSIETRIFEANKARVASLPMATRYPVKWTDGPEFKPQVSDRYLRATWTPNQTQRVFIGSNDPHRRPGVLQIDVFEPKTQRSIDAVEVAGQVARHFPADLRFSFQDANVRVIKAPSVLAVFTETHHQVPVVIELEAYA
jgi:hypothetical protein